MAQMRLVATVVPVAFFIDPELGSLTPIAWG